MQFLYPTFLYALFATLIPVIIHLFYFRRYRKLIFPDLRFLKELEEVSKSNRKLRDLLILICRILTIAFLVFAFAQPFIPHNKTTRVSANKSVAIYIDNSFSMLREGKEGPLLEVAKNKARAIGNAYANDAEFFLLTNHAEAGRWFSKAEAMQRIDEIKVAPVQRTMSEVQQKVEEAWYGKPEKDQTVYLISDFQTEAFKANHFTPDSSVEYHFIPVQTKASGNISVDSAWVISPFVRLNQPVKIKVKIHNGNEERSDHLVVSLKVNGVQKAIQNLSVESGNSSIAEFSYTPTGDVWQQGEIALEDYPVTFDDKLFFVLKAREFNTILCINHAEGNPFIKKLFSGDADYRLNEVAEQAIDYSTLQQYALIILNEPDEISSGLQTELQKYVSNGGQLLVIPSVKGIINPSLNQLLGSFNAAQLGTPVTQNLSVDKLQLTDPFFRDVFTRIPSNPDLPSVVNHYPLLRSSSTRGKMLMELNNGDAFLWYSPYNTGRVVVSAVPFNGEFSNFTQHALFVPAMLKLAMGITGNRSIYYTLKPSLRILLNKEELEKKLIRLSNGAVSFSGELSKQNGMPSFILPEQMQQAGIYTCFFDGEKNPSGYVAVNYNRTESAMEFDYEEQLKGINPAITVSDEEADQLGSKIKAEMEGVALWRYMLCAALFFILAELVLLRVWRK